MRTVMTIAAIATLALAGVAQAKSCKDSHGKFITCPSAAAAAKNGKTAASVAKKEVRMEANAAATMAGRDKNAAVKDAKIAVAASKRAHRADLRAAKATGRPPHCSQGKPCGASCIPMDRICHK